MATLQKIRNQAGILVAIIIGLALVAFILGDMLQSGSSLFRKRQLELGKINGESIQYPDFQRRVDELGEIYKSNTGQNQLDENAWVQVREQTWQTMVREKIMGDVYDELGLNVSSEELFDMLQGTNIHPIVQQIFTNPNTGEFDRSAVVNFLKNLETGVSPEQKSYWLYLEKQIQSERVQSKYNNLIRQGLYVTSAEAEQSLKDKNKQIAFDYIALNHSSVADSQVVVSEAELKAYYAKHEKEYKEEKTRRIEYVTFTVTPSTSDFNDAQKWINDIQADFTNTTDNVQFVNSNSDVRFEDVWHKISELPANIATWITEEGAAVNSVFGPYFENNAYKLAKLHAVEMVPDSVEARHILLRVNSAAEAVLAQSLADSLKTVIEKGGDFAALARQYSSDTGSAMNGGDLGWFGRGMMVKPFEEAAFNNKTGQVTIANSQFGIHIIQTTRRGVETKQYQIAYLVRNVVPSTQTYQNTYAIASKFVSENTDKAKFDAAVEEQKLTKKVATLRENDREIAGLDNPRPLVRAAFEAEKGNILKSTDGSPIFEFGDNFVVGTLVEATQEGIAPFAAVRDRVELAVRKEKKGELLAEKIKTAAAGKTDLFDIAQTLGTTVQSASNVNFNSFSIPGVGVEPAVIGTVASIEPNVVPAPVKGNNAVFLVKVSSVTEGTDTDLTGEKNRLAQSIGYRAGFQAYDAHQKAVEIVDKRAKFY